MQVIEQDTDSMLDCQVPAAHPGERTMASFGEELRRQRELRSISLREISDATKINIRFLEALEQNDFKHLPGGQFNKGFIRAYARHLGMDGEEMVDAYLLELRHQDDSPGAPGRTAAARRGGLGWRAVTAAAIGVIGLLAAGWLLWHFSRSAGKRHAAASPAPTAEAVPPPAARAVAPAPVDILSGPDAAGAPTPPSDTGSARPEGNLIMRVVPLQTAGLQLQCDGKQIFSGELQAGRAFRFDCPGVYEISMEDAGAVNLSINGERIYLGRPGQTIAGRHISAANYVDFLTPRSEAAPR